ncbi:nectin cell adhesion molecule 1b isoform X2 [Erpetoichthys calabaricus]|uniref:nectin cell adhesion molecule 1b isoform X2 n=1 Tax=Erpetoichthys calabaricus TaxID=27687 RepID=UPI0022342686|nr:nectin cell adhesion molecule 1b isoform X2 [Erpetoichthys calabaricus]XP_051787743.1 nectin cell adhesion molecule 1b isoform X2 [Erpetoichthys calabaricus]
MLSSCWILVVAAILPATQTQLVQMDDRVSGMVGTDVLLTCKYSNRNPNVKITQVTWQKLLNGTKVNVAIANPTLGVSVLESFKERVMFRNPLVTQANPSLEDASIFMKQLQLSDEATYICEYATFPAGNRENQVNLTVLARPTNQVILTSPTIVAQSSQTSKMIVATCISSNGKPPSDITWETKLRGEATFHKIPNPNGTVTVRSDYWVVPSRESHRQKLTCIVSYQGEKMRQQSVTLNVQYEPQVTIEGFDGNWYLNRQDVQLTCKSDANPAVTTYQWKLLNGSMPNNVEIQNNSLFFKGPVTYELAGTYMCEATNSVGKRSEQVEVNVTDKPLPQGAPGGVIGIMGGVVAAGLIIGVAVTVFVVYRRQQKTRTETDNDLCTDNFVASAKTGSPKRTDLPPAHKPAPPPPKKKTTTDMKTLTSDDIQVVHLDKPEEEMQKLPLQPPYYDMAPSDSTPYPDKLNSGHKDYDVQYAELDTTALASSPSPRSSVNTGGDLVEYATIQPNLR